VVRGRLVSVVLVALTALVVALASGCAPAPQSGQFEANYGGGLRAQVEITGTDGGYSISVTADAPVQGRTCVVVAGTEIATFSLDSDGVYRGEHELVGTNCSEVGTVTMRLSEVSTTGFTENLDRQFGTFTYSRKS
jgi:hypothetical protein